jgi:hypothetical protein
MLYMNRVIDENGLFWRGAGKEIGDLLILSCRGIAVKD